MNHIYIAAAQTAVPDLYIIVRLGHDCGRWVARLPVAWPAGSAAIVNIQNTVERAYQMHVQHVHVPQPNAAVPSREDWWLDIDRRLPPGLVMNLDPRQHIYNFM